MGIEKGKHFYYSCLKLAKLIPLLPCCLSIVRIKSRALYLLINLTNTITIALPIMIPASWNPLKSIEVNTSLQPQYPELQLTSKGQKKETGELVKKKSAKICEKMTKKQLPNFILGIWCEIFHAFDAKNPIIKAKIKL